MVMGGDSHPPAAAAAFPARAPGPAAPRGAAAPQGEPRAGGGAAARPGRAGRGGGAGGAPGRDAAASSQAALCPPAGPPPPARPGAALPPAVPPFPPIPRVDVWMYVFIYRHPLPPLPTPYSHMPPSAASERESERGAASRDSRRHIPPQPQLRPRTGNFGRPTPTPGPGEEKRGSPQLFVKYIYI